MRTITGFIYRNLHIDGVCYSVKDVSTGKVILHAPNIVVKNARFVVQKGGQEKVRQLGRKQVHAGVRGEVVVDPTEITAVLPAVNERVFYNPYVNDTFVDGSGSEVSVADYVYLTSKEGKSCVLRSLNV